MRIRITIAAITAALAFTVTACGSNDSGSDKAEATKSSSEPSADYSAAEKAAGIPPKPDAATRTALIEVLKAINPALVTDEDKAIDNARNQCSTISGGGNADQTAKARFSTSDHEVTDAEAQAINAALKASLCTS
ncbi:hypothetical protein [Streptomyces sp. NPDC088794]|uniref:hypothetical protein n=1 Tax=Streptomyces sp. NPDC088794 TaxID=3365902 RepID=UPI00380888F9